MTKTHRTLLAAGAALIPGFLQAAIVGPYAVDANTTQLYHFDEAAGSTTATNSVTGGLELSSVNITADGVWDTNTSILGASGYSGFGNSADMSGDANDSLLYTTSQVTPPTVGFSATTGFTMEALINTSSITDGQQEIISLDSNGSRSFQFVISSAGELRYQVIGGSNPQYNFNIPTTGPDAFQADTWFHVAVTYTGQEGVANNLSVYWTLLDGSRTEANLLGNGTLAADWTGNGYFVVGNEGRRDAGENLKGLIDEVRISNIARGADEMMFAVPEPATFALLFGGLALGLAVWRRRR
ncbi:MAG: LamG domain-containing protein [Oceanipulchritudo sp.]